MRADSAGGAHFISRVRVKVFASRLRTEIIGHRGAPRAAIENTLPAFSTALELGADAIELDVHATSDGVVLIHHDASPRVAHADGRPERRPFAELTAAEVRTLRFPDGSRIPSLDELLELVGTRATVYVEIKGRDIEAAVLAALDRHATAVAVHSFDHRVIHRVSAARPTLRCGILLSSYVLDAPALLRGAGAVDLWQEWQSIDEPLVSAVHLAGGRVIAWTVNEPAAIRRLHDMGVDAICTDVPGVALDALR